MCKGSVNARKVRDVEFGDRLVLGLSLHGIPVLRRPTDLPDHITCVRTGHRLKFDQVPGNIQRILKVGQTFVADFIEDIDDTADLIRLEDGRIISLFRLTNEFNVEKIVIDDIGQLSDEMRQNLLDEVSGRAGVADLVPA